MLAITIEKKLIVYSKGKIIKNAKCILIVYFRKMAIDNIRLQI